MDAVWVGFNCTSDDPADSTVNLMTQLQEALSGFIFLILTAVLLVYGFRLYRLASAGRSQYVQVRQRANSTWQIVGITTVIILIFATRAVHDFLGISPRYRQTLDHPLPWFDFLCFLFWEVTPSTMVLVFFRRIPKITYSKTAYPSLQTAVPPVVQTRESAPKQGQSERYRLGCSFFSKEKRCNSITSRIMGFDSAS